MVLELFQLPDVALGEEIRAHAQDLPQLDERGTKALESNPQALLIGALLFFPAKKRHLPQYRMVQQRFPSFLCQDFHDLLKSPDIPHLVGEFHSAALTHSPYSFSGRASRRQMQGTA